MECLLASFCARGQPSRLASVDEPLGAQSVSCRLQMPSDGALTAVPALASFRF